MSAVSVWDHQPTADELLDARIAAGWTPTPTGTVDGPVVLGHAACRMMNKTAYVSPPYVRGAAVDDREALLSWLATQSKRVRVPAVISRSRVGFSGQGAKIGVLDVDITDYALGVPLSERCRQRAGDAETCAVWLEGRWKGEHDGRYVFEVVHVGESIADVTAATHAEGEAS